MNHKYKRKWVAALRSGHYEQIHGQLVGIGKRRCAIGVLMDVIPDPNTSGIYLTSDSVEIGLPNDAQENVVAMNDGCSPGRSSRRYTFDQIADWIEANL